GAGGVVGRGGGGGAPCGRGGAMPARRGRPRTVAAVLSTVLAAGVAVAAPDPAAPAATAPASYQSATACAKCHQTIHLYWSESEHGRSAVKPSYLEALRTAVEGAADHDRAR